MEVSTRDHRHSWARREEAGEAWQGKEVEEEEEEARCTLKRGGHLFRVEEENREEQCWGIPLCL